LAADKPTAAKIAALQFFVIDEGGANSQGANVSLLYAFPFQRAVYRRVAEFV